MRDPSQGRRRGREAVGGEVHQGQRVAQRDIDLASEDPARVDNFHVQMVCRAVLGGKEQGVGVFEQLILGVNPRLGLDSPGALGL